MNSFNTAGKTSEELKSTVTGKSFQQLTTRSLTNFDRTSAEQRFLNSLWLCPLAVERVAVSKSSLSVNEHYLITKKLSLHEGAVIPGWANRDV